MCRPEQYTALLSPTQYPANLRIMYKTDSSVVKSGFKFSWECIDNLTGSDKEFCVPDEIDDNMPDAITNAFTYDKLSYTKLGRHQDRLNRHATRRQKYVLLINYYNYIINQILINYYNYYYNN